MRLLRKIDADFLGGGIEPFVEDVPAGTYRYQPQTSLSEVNFRPSSAPAPAREKVRAFLVGAAEINAEEWAALFAELAEEAAS